MKVNSINNASFGTLRGMGETNNRAIFSDLGHKYGIDFIKKTYDAFEEISKTSAGEDVFVKFETTDTDSQNDGLSSRTDIKIVNSNGGEIVKELIDFPDSSFTLFGLNEHLKNLVSGFKTNYVPSVTIDEALDYTIDKFA